MADQDLSFKIRICLIRTISIKTHHCSFTAAKLLRLSILHTFLVICALALFTASTSYAVKPPETCIFRVGVTLPLTGSAKVYGIPNLLGIITAIGSHEPCKQGGKINLIVLDDKDERDIAQFNANALLEQDVSAILGSANTKPTDRLLETVKNNKQKVVVISGQASHSELSLKDTENKNWFFRVTPSNKLMARQVAETIKKRINVSGIGAEKVLILFNGSELDLDESKEKSYSKDMTKLLDKALEGTRHVYRKPHSTSKCNTMRSGDFDWCFKAQAFSGPAVD